MSVKDMTEEERRVYNNRKQKRYDTWKKISQEFRDICREETEEELREREKKKAESERRRLERKEEKKRMKAEEKERERLERRRIKMNKKNEYMRDWRKDRKEDNEYLEHERMLSRERSRRYYARKKE